MTRSPNPSHRPIRRVTLRVAVTLLTVLCSRAASADAPPIDYRLTLGGNLVGGNLHQVQLTANGQLTYDSGGFRNDLLATGFRLWVRPAPAERLVLFGDDVALTDLVTVRVTEAVRIVAMGSVSWSQLHQVDLRLAAGVGPMWQVQERQRGVRVALMGLAEHTRYPSDDFNRTVRDDDGRRTVPRVSLISDGYLKPESHPFSLRYLALLYINPMELYDLRGHLQTAIGFTVVGPIQITLGGQLTGSSVVVNGIQPVDVRTTIGVGLARPQPTETPP